MKALTILAILIAIVGAYLGVATTRDLPPFSPKAAPSESTVSSTLTPTPTPEPTSTPTPEPTPSQQSEQPIEVRTTYKLIAYDDFEGGTWEGGSGWLGPWDGEGYAEVQLSSKAKQGYYHAVVAGKQDEKSWIMRCANLSSATKPKLQFYGRAIDFWFNALYTEKEDYAEVQVTQDGESWHTVAAWFHKDDGKPYRLADIDLSSYAGASRFCIKITVTYESIQMIGDRPLFYIDDIKLVDMNHN